MALSLLPQYDIEENYQLGLKFILKNDPSLKSGCMLTWYALPLNFNLPAHVFIFKKLNSSERIHTHFVAFYFQNYIFSLPLLLNKNDLYFYTDQNIILKQYPPQFTQFTNRDKLRVSYFTQNFSSGERTINYEEELVMQMNPDDLKNAAAYNGNTSEREQKPFNPGNIMKIIIRRNDQGIDPKYFYDVINNL